MTTVRGKQPLKVTSTPEVEAKCYSQVVAIRASGWCGKDQFRIYAELEPHCARNLILELRKALRKIREETCARLQKAVADAEGPL